MTDIELTAKIKNLKWHIDGDMLKSDLIHYKIIKKKEYTDLKSVWISPDMPTVTTVLNDIQRKAVIAYKELTKG
jgi:hypothetical protein